MCLYIVIYINFQTITVLKKSRFLILLTFNTPKNVLNILKTADTQYIYYLATPVNKIISLENASNIHRNLPREIKNIKRGLLKTVSGPQRKLKQLVSLANRVDKCLGWPPSIFIPLQRLLMVRWMDLRIKLH